MVTESQCNLTAWCPRISRHSEGCSSAILRILLVVVVVVVLGRFLGWLVQANRSPIDNDNENENDENDEEEEEDWEKGAKPDYFGSKSPSAWQSRRRDLTCPATG
jgi:cytoskeletal protein RodZ